MKPIIFISLLVTPLLMGCAHSPSLHEAQIFCEGKVQEFDQVSRDGRLHIKCKE